MNIGNTMFNENNFFFRHIIDIREKANGLVTHDHNSGSHFADLFHYGALIVGRRFEHGMKRHYKGDLETVNQRKDINPILSAKNSKLMFKDAKVGSAEVDKICRLYVVSLLFLLNVHFYFGRVGVVLLI